MPKIGAGFLARKREARPSPENLPPGEGRGVPPQLENQADKGAVRPAAEGEDTAPQDAPYFLVAVGDQRSPSFFLFFLAVQWRIALARTPHRAPAIATRQGASARLRTTMAGGLCAGSERQGAGHTDREDGTGRCGRRPVCRLEPEKRGDTPEGGGRGHSADRQLKLRKLIEKKGHQTGAPS
jgi:hypothetical protein